jgi:hypothetical protein
MRGSARSIASVAAAAGPSGIGPAISRNKRRSDNGRRTAGFQVWDRPESPSVNSLHPRQSVLFRAAAHAGGRVLIGYAVVKKLYVRRLVARTRLHVCHERGAAGGKRNLDVRAYRCCLLLPGIIVRTAPATHAAGRATNASVVAAAG